MLCFLDRPTAVQGCTGVDAGIRYRQILNCTPGSFGDRETDHICDTENVNSIYTYRIVHRVLINNLSLIFNGNTTPIGVKRSGNRIRARNVPVYLKRHHDLLL